MGHAPRVLIVDDDPALLEVLATLLELEGFDVFRATGGMQALDAVAEQRPDLVVCDVAMPDIDGLEVCRRLKAGASTATLPVILLTARNSREDRAAGEAAGCDAYLTKPFAPLDLIQVIRELGPDRAAGPQG